VVEWSKLYFISIYNYILIRYTMDNTIVQVDSCIICLSESSDIVKFKGRCRCQPTIHPVCISEWMEKNNQQCPICRISYIVAVQPPRNCSNIRRLACLMFLMFVLPLCIIFAFLFSLLNANH